jgi:hypothetical protein
MISPFYLSVSLSVCLSVCTPITPEPISRFLSNSVAECDLDVILFNPVASTIQKWRMFRLLRWNKNLYHSTRDNTFCMLIDIKRINDF